ncbi:SAVED domain-containing protein [Kribbella sp. NPDC051936]|uniref:SAVED domain-containing protein n=1 Tax=Kribbella sp. NPDC051936 TaxID=3154946 RepID=UPI003447271F
MRLPARGAAIRGDDYQHIIGLYYAACVLTDPNLESVSIEDADGGAFDDIVVRATASSGKPHLYIQVKSGVHRDTVIDHEWLTSKRTQRSKSPLQRLHQTWAAAVVRQEDAVFRLLTNKNFDHADPILGLIDNQTDKIPQRTLDGLTPTSAGGRQIQSWADQLDVSVDELKRFVAAVEFVHGEADHSWATRAGAYLRNAGLRSDDDAIARGREMVRGWVTSGAGIRTTDDIRAEVATMGLLARDGELVLAIHAIDRTRSADRPNAQIDIVDLYPDVDPFQRRELLDPSAWDEVVLPKLTAAKRDLEGFNSRRLHIAASMRLPLYFAVGRTFPDVGSWVLSTDQRGVVWATAVEHEDAILDVRSDEHLGDGPDLAVGIALTHDPAPDVRKYILASGLAVGRLLSLSTPDGPSSTSVPGPGWAASWVRRAREHVRAVVREMNAAKVHLFIASPAGVAMFLGHDWNLLPTTLVYDHVGTPGYSPTMTLLG